MQLNLDTIIIFCRDTNSLKSFYAGTLQLPILEEQPSEWVLLQAGNGKIGLHKIGQSYPDTAGSQESNTKIVFETTEDIQTVRQRLIAKNILMNEVRTFDRYDFFVCDGKDPEGNVFQLKQKK